MTEVFNVGDTVRLTGISWLMLNPNTDPFVEPLTPFYGAEAQIMSKIVLEPDDEFYTYTIRDPQDGGEYYVFDASAPHALYEAWGAELLERAEDAANDPVNPSHYKDAYPVEVIELTEHMNFNRGNAVKYIARAGLKHPSTEIEDLRKAKWCIEREIARMQNG